jgi:serine kinase of HPr protein (carbohydrate metabolism regulator)
MSDQNWLARVRWQASTEGVGDECPFRWGVVGNQYVAEWGGIAIARFEANGEVIGIMPAPDAPQPVLERLIHGGIAAFSRGVSGKPSLHAAAVEWQGRALLLVGGSGAGKSTMASEVCRSGMARLLADDVAGLDCIDGAWHAMPSESCNWLFENGVSGRKAKTTPVLVASRPARIVAIVSLAFDDVADVPRTTRLRNAEALRVLLGAPLRFELSPESRVRELETLAALIRQAKVYELARSRGAANVTQTAGVLSALLRGESGEER